MTFTYGSTELDRLRRKEEKEKYLSPLEVAEQLSISRWTVYGWLSAGRIRSTKIGRLRRIAQSEVDRLVAEGDAPRLEDRMDEIAMDDSKPDKTHAEAMKELVSSQMNQARERWEEE